MLSLNKRKEYMNENFLLNFSYLLLSSSLCTYIHIYIYPPLVFRKPEFRIDLLVTRNGRVKFSGKSFALRAIEQRRTNIQF